MLTNYQNKMQVQGPTKIIVIDDAFFKQPVEGDEDVRIITGKHSRKLAEALEAEAELRNMPTV